ncbi:hypothetical protein NECAME_03549 [Necator americanus]|uniref:Uncharacterized protein n=1 Tax=Necator americanus TaxID=51031 RepID=W2T4L9_NECAM|nr:hypothetical protein NECAME_03549 [Necator americanus]ETN76176.1 hypothetical protein NECAME_03549 [Necator americanus]
MQFMCGREEFDLVEHFSDSPAPMAVDLKRNYVKLLMHFRRHDLVGHFCLDSTFPNEQIRQ